ncbi:hypothetical protein OCV73_00040 [Barnesiella propionica]|uniref:hypothetical protein n=1 Tax=Barnesiella propionica TaxID=2981781 RepID=UPI0011C954E5|nr:hypothetical protein [Barnesiella propionica]MCU6767351.1 hypothetical protein [Barnesiella propionica]
MAKKTISITLYLSELIYDVQNKTYLTARSRYNGNNYKEIANMQADDDDENSNQIIRSIGNAFAILKTKLCEYIFDSGDTASDEQIITEGELTLTLEMPHNYNPATRKTIASAMHQFIVDSAVGDWFIITNKSDATDYMTMAAAQLVIIREAINKRVRPTKPNI